MLLAMGMPHVVHGDIIGGTRTAVLSVNRKTGGVGIRVRLFKTASDVEVAEIFG